MRIHFSTEAATARRAGKALVALETSVLAQGLPYPHNLRAAQACEAAIREAGAVPVTMAVLDGHLHAGLEASQLMRLAKEKSLWKIASRDLALAMAQHATGGTTVSATCEMAAAAGIQIFATGGIGGVHRGVETHWDVSQDLPALARFPVAVVCAGPKSVLDVPKTLEYLETMGVPVVGVGTKTLPGFYSRSTGIALEHSVDGPDGAASVLRARRSLNQGGLLFALPPPKATALPQKEVEKMLAAALAAAQKQNIDGKALTPFLLEQMRLKSKGETLRANVALLENNARFAAQTAVSLGWH
jgi:pseudouridylate synthase